MNAPAPTQAPQAHQPPAVFTGPDPSPYAIAAPTFDSRSLMTSQFDQLMRVGEFMAKGRSSLPEHLRGNPTDCFSVACVAYRANLDPFGVGRKTWKGPNGQLEYEGQLVIALINNSGMLVDRLKYEWFGQWERIVGKFVMKQSRTKKDEHGEPKRYLAPDWDPDRDEVGLGIRVWATLKGESEPRVLELLMKQCRTRNSTLWVEDPKQQIGYLAARRWGRLHTPEAILGINTPDERMEPLDMGDVEEVQKCPPELLEAAEAAAAKGVKAYGEFWRQRTHLERAQLDDLSGQHDRLKGVAEAADKNRTVDIGPGATPRPTAAPAATPAPTPAPSPTAAPSGDGGPRWTWAQLMEDLKAADDEMKLLLVVDRARDLGADQRKEIEAAAADRARELNIDLDLED